METEKVDHLTDIHHKLEQGFQDLTSTEGWKQWLKIVRSMPRYSLRNQLLIAMQRPDATQVASFNRWKQLGRQVRRHEHAIWILAPVSYKRAPHEGEQPQDVPSNEKTLRGFKAVPVFSALIHRRPLGGGRGVGRETPPE